MPFHNIFSKKQNKKQTLNHPKPKIIIDYREKESLVPSELIHIGCEPDFKNLQVGDYIINHIIIERKTINDFIGSMLNKRLLIQLQNLQQQKNKLLIIEGDENQELYHEKSKINENAIRGMLLSILLKYQVPVLTTKNPKDTAKFLKILANKQQKEISLLPTRKPTSQKQQLQFILEGFPGIGPKTAKTLLKEFKSIRQILNTPQEQIQKLIGKKADIFKLLDLNY